MSKEVKIGDKFVIEVGHIYGSPYLGNRYFIKGFNSMVLDDYAIEKLEPYKEPPKAVPHTCANCKHQKLRIDEYPCLLCDKNQIEPSDMFVPADNG